MYLSHWTKLMCLYSTKSKFTATLPPFDYTPEPYQGISYDQIVSNRKKYLPRAYFHYYKNPLMLIQGKYQYLYDHKGRRYLDLFAGIATVNVGHSHPRIVNVIKKQAEKIMHTSSLYLSQNQVEYSKLLAEDLGDPFESIILTNSGGQSNDLAVVLARLASKKSTILSIRHGYHGLVGYTRSLTNVPQWIIKTDFPNFNKLLCPRPIHQTMGVQDMLGDVDDLIKFQTDGQIAGVIFQLIQGVGGINDLPKEYIDGIIKRVKQKGGIIICDEVQTGFGRIGKDFWGFKWRDIKPDIITMAKGIGNGMPLGAIATNKKIAEQYKSLYFNTYGGGYLQSKVGTEVLKILREQKLHLNAEKQGNLLLNGLLELKEKYQIIGSVRGKGLMIGIQFMRNNEPAIAETVQFLDRALQKNLLLGKGGAGNVLRIQPPLCISQADVRYTLDAMEHILSELK